MFLCFFRLTRSSSSSDCEYTPSSVHSKGKSRSSQKNFSHHNNALLSSGQAVKPKQKMVPTPHHRLSRRSSAELLRKNHPYSSSTEDDSDSGHNNVSERDESLLVPQLPPRRAHGNSKRNSVNVRPNPDGSLSSNGDKSLEEVRISRSRTPDFGIDCSKVFLFRVVSSHSSFSRLLFSLIRAVLQEECSGIFL